ncbi:30S ribosomal protein S2, partial [Staphylococcus aureus]|nr:30S ribosomal protein S2 [Staphylococcus aureus]
PVVAVLDTNCDPDFVDFPIPGNDDAIGAVKLLTYVVGEAVIAGKQQREERQLAAARDAAGDNDAKLQAEATEAAAQA